MSEESEKKLKVNPLAVIAGIIVLIAFWFGPGIFEGLNQNISLVKSGAFSFAPTVTVEKIMQALLVDGGDWSHFELNNKNYVSVSGKYIAAKTPGGTTRFVFSVDFDSGQFQLDSVDYDGMPESLNAYIKLLQNIGSDVASYGVDETIRRLKM